jgi:hypothetical protein
MLAAGNQPELSAWPTRRYPSQDGSDQYYAENDPTSGLVVIHNANRRAGNCTPVPGVEQHVVNFELAVALSVEIGPRKLSGPTFRRWR